MKYLIEIRKEGDRNASKMRFASIYELKTAIEFELIHNREDDIKVSFNKSPVRWTYDREKLTIQHENFLAFLF